MGRKRNEDAITKLLTLGFILLSLYIFTSYSLAEINAFLKIFLTISLVVLVLVVTIITGYYFYRNNQRKKMLDWHNQYSQKSMQSAFSKTPSPSHTKREFHQTYQHHPQSPLPTKNEKTQNKQWKHGHKKKKPFLPPAEKEFKEHLRKHLPDNIEIQCKTRLADVLTFETNSWSLIMMHIDYVLSDAKTQNILLAIELDDKSHDTEKAKKRDAKKNEALEKSGIKLIRVPNSNKYHPALIKKIIEYCKSITSPDFSG